jgi:hypothetical protein
MSLLVEWVVKYIRVHGRRAGFHVDTGTTRQMQHWMQSGENKFSGVARQVPEPCVLVRMHAF